MSGKLVYAQALAIKVIRLIEFGGNYAYASFAYFCDSTAKWFASATFALVHQQQTDMRVPRLN